eukprot:2846714-Pyramimonas_sp.AAC.1
MVALRLELLRLQQVLALVGHVVDGALELVDLLHRLLEGQLGDFLLEVLPARGEELRQHLAVVHRALEVGHHRRQVVPELGQPGERPRRV